jgi:hypothetical protein
MIIKDTSKISGQLTLEFRNVITGEVDIIKVKNLFTTVGKEAIAARLSGVTANNKGTVTYCAVGLDSTAPALGNIKLGNELARKAVSVRSVANNIATFQTFFTTSEAIGALKEAGLFGDDASSTQDSGTLFAHTAINRTKSANDTLTILWELIVG